MDFELTEEQKQLGALIRQFCKREVDLKRMRELADKAAKAKTAEELRALQPWDLLKKLHEVGLRQLCVPTRYGGGGADRCGYVTRAIAAEQVGYSIGIVARLLGLPWVHCATIAADNTTEEQKDWFFSQFMENHTMSMGGTASEPAGNSDFHLPYDEPGVGLKTFAYKDGNEWVINGDKMFSSGGGVADLFMAVVRTDEQGPISQSTSNFWVRKDAPGVTMTPNRMLAAELAGNVQTHYDNVRVPESHLIGEVNKGYSVFESVQETKWIYLIAFLGNMQRLYEQIVDYAKERIQGGKPIIQHSSVEVVLGEAAINLEATRALMYRAAWESDQREKAGGRINRFWNAATYYLLKKTGLRLCEIASDIYGGIGGSVDMPLESFVRHSFLFLPAGGTNSINAILCSKEYNR